MSHCSSIKKGDAIKLNEKAREWTIGLILTVDEVKAWGVICSVELSEPPEGVLAGVHRVVDGTGRASSLAYYRATWDQIGRIVEQPFS